MSRVDLPRDQEDRANEALGALNGLYDLIACRDIGIALKSEDIVYVLRLCIRSVEHAIPDGQPKHRRAVNDTDME